MKRRSRLFIILVMAIAMTLTISVGAVSFAKWSGGESATSTADVTLGYVSTIGVTIDMDESMLVGEGGRLMPFSMTDISVKIPDRRFIKLVFENETSDIPHHYEISSVHSGSTEYVNLYYWNATGEPNAPVGTSDWTAITTTAAELTVSGLGTGAGKKTVYIAYDTNELSDAGKSYQVTIVAAAS